MWTHLNLDFDLHPPGIRLEAQLVGKKRQFTSISIADIYERKQSYAQKLRVGDRVVYVGSTILADDATLEEVWTLLSSSDYPLLIGFEKARPSPTPAASSAASKGKLFRRQSSSEMENGALLPSPPKVEDEPKRTTLRWDMALEKYVYAPRRFTAVCNVHCGNCRRCDSQSFCKSGMGMEQATHGTRIAEQV